MNQKMMHPPIWMLPNAHRKRRHSAISFLYVTIKAHDTHNVMCTYMRLSPGSTLTLPALTRQKSLAVICLFRLVFSCPLSSFGVSYNYLFSDKCLILSRQIWCAFILVSSNITTCNNHISHHNMIFRKICCITQ